MTAIGDWSWESPSVDQRIDSLFANGPETGFGELWATSEFDGWALPPKRRTRKSQDAERNHCGYEMIGCSEKNSCAQSARNSRFCRYIQRAGSAQKQFGEDVNTYRTQTPEPLVFTQEFIVAAKSFITSGNSLDRWGVEPPNQAPKSRFLCS